MSEPRKRVSEPASDDASVALASTPGAAGYAGSDSLDQLRDAIDAVDRKLLDALNERARLVERVGVLKRARAQGVFSAARERDLIQALVAENPGPFPNAAIPEVFRAVVSGTRSLETELRIAYLGPEGTFSHQAALRAFGGRCRFESVASITEVFAAVERGIADHGIVPVENTTEGVVTATLDAFVGSDVPICGETLLRISHHLLSRADSLDAVERVVSHPQPLAQCRQWLDRHLPKAERIEASSTASAAEQALADPRVAAIGGALLGERTGLAELAAAIEDRRDNTTRFLLIGGDRPGATGNDLTSVAFTVRKSESGALHRLLEPFARHGVNLTSIQARPLRGAPWEYVFLLDLEGHRDDASVRGALDEAGRGASSCRILGSFPRSAQTPRPPSDRSGGPA